MVADAGAWSCTVHSLPALNDNSVCINMVFPPFLYTFCILIPGP